VKNRYGPTDEVGCFDLGEYGLIGLPDPSGLFLSQHREPVPGTCVTVTLEGRRPLPAEVQALVGFSALEIPRRTTSGLDGSRVGMVLAVLQRRAGLKLGKQDVYAATVGGVRLTEPSVDLAVAVALASSAANLSVPHGVVAIGEVGLAGEVRRVSGLPRRLAEAERMGFRRVIVPAASGAPLERADGLTHLMQVEEVEDIRQALSAVLGTDLRLPGSLKPRTVLRHAGVRHRLFGRWSGVSDAPERPDSYAAESDDDALRRAGIGLVCAQRAGSALARS
jgi:DNA repair protein RadA/Sms